jgi:hypothetical protein
LHIETQSFSGSSSESFDNVFTSTFENYKILLSGTVASGVPRLRLRWRASGSDNSTSDYNFQEFRSGSTTVTSTRFGSQAQNEIGLIGTSETSFSIDVFNPQSAKETAFLSNSMLNGDAVAFFYGGFYDTTSFDGFSIFPVSSTMTATIRIYGYKN